MLPSVVVITFEVGNIVLSQGVFGAVWLEEGQQTSLPPCFHSQLSRSREEGSCDPI